MRLLTFLGNTLIDVMAVVVAITVVLVVCTISICDNETPIGSPMRGGIEYSEVLYGLVDGRSMLPSLSEGNIIMYTKEVTYDNIMVGDIIGARNTTHRVVDIGYDEYGWFAITKGDNNRTLDDKKVRKGDIKYLVLGIMY